MKGLLFIVILIIFPLATLHAEVVDHSTSTYQDIYIRDSGKHLRCMHFTAKKTAVKHYQGCIFKNNKKMVFSYTKALMSTLLLRPDPKRILVIGLGAGVLPFAFNETVPNALIEVVEIDPVVVSLARKHFNWREDTPRLKTYVSDGRVFVKGAAQQGVKYDIVVLDAYNSEYIPEHLMTLEFFNEVKAILKPSGVIAANTFAHSQLYDHESMTYQTAFGDFFNIQMDGKKSNRVIVGGVPIPNVEYIRANALRYAKHFYHAYDINVNDLLTNMENAKDWDQKARVLTDQYSPANILAGRDRLQQSWNSTLAARLETMSDEHPVATAIGLLAIVVSLLFAIMKFFDFLVLLRRPAKPSSTDKQEVR